MLPLVFVLVAYLLGAIPFGLIVGRLFRGVDIREHGSGNIGFTNAMRVLGPRLGALVFVLDMGKGFVGTALPQLVYKHPELGGSSPTATYAAWVAVVCALAVIAGHNWSVFLGFTGGKGVAAGVGAAFALAPAIAVAVLVIWGITLALTRYVSVASIAAVASFPVFVVAFYRADVPYLVLALIGSAAIIFQHRGNIRRLMRGEEPKIGQREAAT